MSWDLSLPGLGPVLHLAGCPEVLSALQEAMPGWPVEVIKADVSPTTIRLHRDGEGYCQHSPALPDGLFLTTPAQAVCSLIADLVGEYFDRHPDCIGLHCGSAEVAGRLVVFPESHRAGKSTLTAAFAAAGYRVFGDDVLALTPEGLGRGLGIAPRLRLPLPDSLDPGLIDFATRHAGPEDDRYRYLMPPQSQLAAHGEEAPLGALVLFEREVGLMIPEILPLAPGEGLLQLLCQNFAHDARSETMVERFLPLMGEVPCLLLRYSEPLAAARALGDALAGPLPATLHEIRLASRPATQAAPLAAGPWAPEEAVLDYPLGEELFLVDATSGAIHRLNATGRLIWQMLRHEPLSPEELSELIGEHFGQPSARVLDDVQALLVELAGAGLVSPAMSITAAQ
ncbi:PqqD family protein [Halomonas tibetensis]|uniref:PqqD family protein n=1 Tax=Halomonas tibetensis TaxID=2259590 RepID=A0ABV7B9W7_9GAMM